jgi:hypothetical protein
MYHILDRLLNGEVPTSSEAETRMYEVESRFPFIWPRLGDILDLKCGVWWWRPGEEIRVDVCSD